MERGLFSFILCLFDLFLLNQRCWFYFSERTKDKVISRISNYNLDVSGHKCPIPVLRLRRFLEKLSVGDVVSLLATDPMTLIDVPNFCREAGHSIESVTETDDNILYLIKKC